MSKSLAELMAEAGFAASTTPQDSVAPPAEAPTPDSGDAERMAFAAKVVDRWLESEGAPKIVRG